MKLRKDQYEALLPYEKQLHHALYGNWVEAMGKRDVLLLHNIFEDATGEHRAMNLSCSRCVLSLARDVGRLFFADREEYLKEAERIASEISQEQEEIIGREEKSEIKPKKAVSSKKTSKTTTKGGKASQKRV